MNFEEIKQIIIQKFGEPVILTEENTGLQPALVIEPSMIAEVCLELRDNEKTYFDFLASLSGVDYGTEEKRFGVVYHLTSIPYKLQLTLKCRLEYDQNINSLPAIPTVSTVWRTAEWHEREAYDFYGIYFENHPDLRRILLPDDWEGYPLRKDYVEAEEYKGIKIK